MHSYMHFIESDTYFLHTLKKIIKSHFRSKMKNKISRIHTCIFIQTKSKTERKKRLHAFIHALK